MMNRKGFTLIEILVVLGIIGTFTLFALPTFYNFSAQLSLNAVARSLTAELRGLQSQAVLEHKDLSLDLTDRGFPAGIHPVKLSKIVFSASGCPPPGGSGTLILANRFGQEKRIIISSAGRVRLE